MFPDLAFRVKNFAANMGSGFTVIAGFMLAVTMVFVMVFARWNGVSNKAPDYSNNTDKPRVETSIKHMDHGSKTLPDNSGN